MTHERGGVMLAVLELMQMLPPASVKADKLHLYQTCALQNRAMLR